MVSGGGGSVSDECELALRGGDSADLTIVIKPMCNFVTYYHPNSTKVECLQLLLAEKGGL